MRKIIFIFVSILCVACASKHSNLKTHTIFADHMVLQRNMDIPVYGYATPYTNVSVAFSGVTLKTKADENGKWKVVFPPFEAGGPYEISITANDTSFVLKDILIGDVWVCSGQSNMEWHLADAANGESEADSALYPEIRYAIIQKDMEFHPLDSLRNPIQWLKADNKAIRSFSAVGYFFGKELHKRLDVPIGLIGDYWGGTEAESWTSTKVLGTIPDFENVARFVDSIPTSLAQFEKDVNADLFKWINTVFHKGKGMDEAWYLPETNVSEWKDITVPGYWEDQFPELANYDGSAWYRKTFDVPSTFMGNDIKLYLSMTNDHNIVWLNGEKLGEIFGADSWTNFIVPASLIKEKNNVIVVRIFDTNGKGGFSGLPGYFDVHTVTSYEQKINISGTWKFMTGSPFDSLQRPKPFKRVNDPNNYVSLLYNAMLHPIMGQPIKGVIWYQGEGNASRAYQYRTLFPEMIKNWRSDWNIGDFPFLFVQLANYIPGPVRADGSDWAELREAQAMTLSLPNTGMAVTMDIGNPNNIHPRNKKDVGKRLALAAFKTVYGIDTVFSGPTYKKLKIEKNKAILTFENIGSGLTTVDGKAPKAFTISGSNNIFYDAQATIIDGKIVVHSDKVNTPVAVRYAWVDNTVVNLINKEGLPTVPFRTDTLPGITVNNK